MDFSGQKVLVGMSGGINSMGVLCWLATLPKKQHPAETHLFCANFKEHSPDTLLFVLAGVAWARTKMDNVVYEQTENSVMDFFEESNMIPHPTNSACSRLLKIEPMLRYAYQNNIQIDLIGYVAKEVKRAKRAEKAGSNDLFFRKDFPILDKDDDWCFQIVDENIGWHPKIYDIKEDGKRVFTHNNCLPCKNMTPRQLKKTAQYFPEKFARAKEVEAATGSYFGRDCAGGCVVCEFD